MRFLLKFFFLFTPVLAFSQKLPEIDALNRVILNHKDSIIYAHLLPVEDNNRVKASDAYWYNWYAQHDIKETRGGFDGKLLHGTYTEYYDTKDLKKKGWLNKGLKKGKWKSWYKNGQLQEIVYYKKGWKHGKYTSFNSNGSIASKGRYKRGVLVVKKEKKKREKKNKKGKVENAVPKDKKKKEKTSEKKKGKEKKAVEAQPEAPATTAPDQKGEIKKEKKKKGKEPKIRVRRSIKIVPQPGKST